MLRKKDLMIIAVLTIVISMNLICADSKIFLTSIPKCGTHLINKCITEITGLKRSRHFDSYVSFSQKETMLTFFGGHSICTPDHVKLIEAKKFKGILMVRDPRDQCVSMVLYAKKFPRRWPKLASMNVNEAISAWILDTSLTFSKNDFMWNDLKIKSFTNISDFYSQYMSWMNYPFMYTTTFERLVGPYGGGSREAQIHEITNIANHLEVPVSQEQARQIGENIFGNSATFRKGQIGSWKEYFTEEHKELFKEIAGQLLVDLGYEQDHNW